MVEPVLILGGKRRFGVAVCSSNKVCSPGWRGNFEMSLLQCQHKCLGSMCGGAGPGSQDSWVPPTSQMCAVLQGGHVCHCHGPGSLDGATRVSCSTATVSEGGSVAWLHLWWQHQCEEALWAGPAPWCLLGQDVAGILEDRHGLETLLTLLWHCQRSRLALMAGLAQQLVPQSIRGCSPMPKHQGPVWELPPLPSTSSSTSHIDCLCSCSSCEQGKA